MLGSTPNLLASLTFTFSSTSWSITSCRGICLWVVRNFSLVRCSTLRLVIGSPVTMQATDCAWSGEGHDSTAAATAQPSNGDQSRRRDLMEVMVMSAVSTNSIRQFYAPFAGILRQGLASRY